MVAFGAIELWVRVVVFGFEFRLSMQHEVFLLSPSRSGTTSAATDDDVVNGLQRSARIITSAAVLGDRNRLRWAAVAEMQAGRDLDHDDRRNKKRLHGERGES